ncbi:MAG TPA: hypothetical protein VMU77_01385, partial [Acidimicrobiales bacterium]|nr:hypothetical protein [Acidimicrobiales bacterium]
MKRAGAGDHQSAERAGLGGMRFPISRVPNKTAAAIIAVVALMATLTAGCSSSSGAGNAPSISVKGNQLVSGNGKSIHLAGVTRQDTESACVNNGSAFSDPSGTASVSILASWHVNTVRILLNEDCWLGINGLETPPADLTYRKAIENYVQQLDSAGIVTIIALGFSAHGTQQANGSGAQFMADADHAGA